ncbi:MAG: hypothetical protein E7311_02995 [Clostridiales bacterium]|nr:hypothetical protein [Clostridiales bacterium]
MKKFLIMVMVIVLTMSTVVLAAPGNISVNVSPVQQDTGNFGNIITGAIQAVAIIVAVAILMYVGVKFMLASPAEKANLKGALVPYIVGAILVFAAVPLVNVIVGMTNNMSN